MLSVRNSAEEIKENVDMFGDSIEGPDESIVRLSECFGQIGKFLYKSFDQNQLLKEIHNLTKTFIESVKTEIYPQLFVNLAFLLTVTAATQVKASTEQSEQMRKAMQRLPSKITFDA